MKKPHWLDEAIFYQIYPQSFMDSNGDGIGDFKGIEEKLDYLERLGINAIWINPCFESSFYDAGYDVKDYYTTAPRYGSNQDLKHLMDAVHKKGMHLLLDLVAGHTAIDHPWFLRSCIDEVNDCTDRYIWRTGGPWSSLYPGIAGFLCGISERPGAVAVNCFSTQPALNYGFGNVTESWQFAADSPEAEEARERLQDIMSFWLDMGCDGFRVDMAGSLVKDDPDKKYTMKLWQKVRKFLDRNYPEAVLVSEWGNPLQALKAGFHMDFLLHGGPTHYMDLFRTSPYFSGNGAGRGSLTDFVRCYKDAYRETKDKGLICIPSGNHDMIRMRDTLSPEEMKLAFAFLLTMPGCPFIYYGDEIGMRYMHGLKSKEGGYERTGSRTPMQWEPGENAGFSSGPSDSLYLPVDTTEDRPTVLEEWDDPDSLLCFVQKLIELRLSHTALRSNAHFAFLTDGQGYPLVFERQSSEEHLLIVLNPSAEQAYFRYNCSAEETLLGKTLLSGKAADYDSELISSYGTVSINEGGTISMSPGSFAVLQKKAVS